MRLPTFSRQTAVDDANTERIPVAPRHDEPTTASLSPIRPDTAAPPQNSTAAPPQNSTVAPPQNSTVAPPADEPRTFRPGPQPVGSEAERAKAVSDPVAIPPAPARRARASFVATAGLVLSVTGALLVLSGPLLGYGVGVSAVALIFSLAGVFATRKRHVAGKTGALIGVALSLAAIVIGVLALAGQLWWLNTETPTVSEFRTWLDTQFETWI